jgi:VCBS repeat-containing protein
VRASDGTAWSDALVVSVSITPANDPPVANARTLAVVEDTAATGTVTGADVDGDSLTYSIAGAAAKGTVQIVNAQTGAFVYTPALNATGTDAFTFRAHDGSLASAPATVTVTIAPVNDAPVAADANAATSGGVAVGTVKATDVDGPALTYALVANGSKGSATLDPATGAFRYTAASGASGTDRFTYRASDGSLPSNVATVTIAIASGNAPPVASNGTTTTKEDRAAYGWLRAVDPEGKRLAYRIVSGPSRGRVLLLNKWTGQYLYLPHHDANGPDAFTFAASDGSSSSNVATLRVTIVPVNDRPVARGGWIATRRNTPTTGRVAAWDVDRDRLTFAVKRPPRRGAVKMNAATGAFVYTPQKGFTGVDELTVRVSDGAGAEDVAVIWIRVKK